MSFGNNSKCILPWTLTQFNESSSVLEFFTNDVKPRLRSADFSLVSAHLGHDMNSLIFVDINLPLVAIVPWHGRFLQYKVSVTYTSIPESITEEEQEESLPSSPFDQRNRKDALYCIIYGLTNLLLYM